MRLANLRQAAAIFRQRLGQARVAALPAWTPQPGPQQQLFASDADEILYGGAAFGGKMLPLDTPVPTPSGWTTIGDLQPGDTIFSEKGEPIEVLQVHPIDPRPKSYELTLDDGTTIKACADHLWHTWTIADRITLIRRSTKFRAERRAKRPSKALGRRSPAFTSAITARNQRLATPPKPAPTGAVRTTAELFLTQVGPRGRRNHAIQVALPLQLPDADLSLDPYLLGLWLGDGTSSTGTVTTADPEMIQAFIDGGFAIGPIHRKKKGRAVTFRVVGLTQKLKTLGVLHNKHLPRAYLRASEGQRLALLQGLMDTDGTTRADNGAVSFTTTRYALAVGAHELVTSLGARVGLSEGRAKLRGRDVGPKWDLRWTSALPCFRLPRKLARQKPPVGHRTRFRTVEKVVPCEPVPMRCITVDNPTGLFLVTCAMVPTHNSAAIVALLTQRIRIRGYRALVLRRTSDDLSHLFDEARWIFHEGRPIGQYAYRAFAPVPETRWFDGSWLISRENGRARFGHCHNDDDYKKYIGLQWDDVLFDELPHFTLKQYTEIIARRRGTIPGLRRRAISTANPPEQDDPGCEWIKARWAPWLDDSFVFDDWAVLDPSTGQMVHGKGLPARFDVVTGADGEPAERRRAPAVSAQVLYVAIVGEGDDARERFSTEPFSWRGAKAETRTFIAAKMSDNKAGLEAEPNYVAKVRQNDPVRAQQLEQGDWNIKPAPGLYFKESWFEVVDEVPPGVASWYRRWDMAATVPTRERPDPDWTEGPRVADHEDGYIYVDDLASCREDPGGTDHFIRQTIVDADGPAVLQVFPMDPGSAGKNEGIRLAQMAEECGSPADVERETGAKSLRIRFLSSVCSPKSNDRAHTKHDGEHSEVPLGRVKVVRGDWNKRLFQQAAAWEPSVSDKNRGKDDILDALAGIVRRLKMGDGAASVSVEVIGGRAP